MSLPHPPAMVLRRRPSGFIKPCQPSRVAKPPSGSDWIHEIKHHGYRLMVRRDGMHTDHREMCRGDRFLFVPADAFADRERLRRDHGHRALGHRSHLPMPWERRGARCWRCSRWAMRETMPTPITSNFESSALTSRKNSLRCCAGIGLAASMMAASSVSESEITAKSAAAAWDRWLPDGPASRPARRRSRGAACRC